MAHVTVAVVDADGTLVPRADARIRFTVEGAGRLLAVGNGDLSDKEPYQADNRRVYHGLALAMIQAGEGPPWTPADRVERRSRPSLRWSGTREEVTAFGVNYSIPFAHGYRAIEYIGADHEGTIDADVYHFARLGLDA